MTTPTPTKKQTNGFKSDVLNLVAVAMKDLGIAAMSPREFSTGSVGLNHSGKVTIEVAGERKQFQVSLNITLAHSKAGDAKRVSDATRTAFLALPPKSLKDLGLEGALVDARIFSKGSVGFYLNSKCVINGQLCQVGCSITAIGSEEWPSNRPAERPAAQS
jgi:hypothetical protein